MPQKTEKIYINLKKDVNCEEIYLVSGGEKPFLVKELAECWLHNIKNIMRPSSFARYQNYSDKYILPYIGEMSCSAFDRNALSAMLSFLGKGHGQGTPVSQYTLYLLESMVHAMFRYGAENNLVPKISFGKAEYMIKNKKVAMPLSELEVQQLLYVLQQQEMDVQVQVILPLYTGISLSELCGLRWEDVNLETGKIHIHRNLVRVQKKDKLSASSNNNSGFIENMHMGSKRNNKMNGKPATILAECELPENECREFIMPEKLNNLLNTLARRKKLSKERYVAELNKKTGRKRKVCIEVSANASTDLSVKSLDSGAEPVPPDSRTLQYRLKSTGEMAGITNLVFQTLRDTFAVMCFQAGGDVYSVAYVLGVNAGAVCDRYKPWLVRKEEFLKGIR